MYYFYNRLSDYIVIQTDVMLIRMVACGAYFGRCEAFVYVSANQALPLDGSVAFPDRTVLNLFQVVVEAVFVTLFDCGDGAEMIGYFVESLFFGSFGESFI